MQNNDVTVENQEQHLAIKIDILFRVKMVILLPFDTIYVLVNRPFEPSVHKDRQKLYVVNYLKK